MVLYVATKLPTSLTPSPLDSVCDVVLYEPQRLVTNASTTRYVALKHSLTTNDLNTRTQEHALLSSLCFLRLSLYL